MIEITGEEWGEITGKREMWETQDERGRVALGEEDEEGEKSGLLMQARPEWINGPARASHVSSGPGPGHLLKAFSGQWPGP